MIVFCHLLNDNSGSPVVLKASLEALNAPVNGLLFVGSDGKGVLEDVNMPKKKYWYRRSRFRIVTLFTYMLSQILLYRALSRSKNIQETSAIYVNTLLPFGALLWAKQRKISTIVHVHEISISPRLLRVFLLACARRCADLAIYVSHDHLSRLPIKGVKSQVLYNPISPNIAEEANRHIRKVRKKFNVLMLASLRPYKGLNEFLALAQEFKERDDINFHLVLNAEPEEIKVFAASRAKMSNLAIYPRTDEPAEFYKNADLVVNLSRVDQWIETFGLTLVEAMAFGLPVIAPPIGGPTEIVSHEKNGFCIDSRDKDALVKAVVLLVEYPDIYAAMSEEARERSKDFLYSSYASNLKSIVGNFCS